VNDETLTAQRPAMSANPIPEAVRAQAAAWFAEYDKHNHFPEMLALDAYAAGHAAAQQHEQAAVELTRDAERYQWLRECAWLHPEAAPACAIFDVDGSMLRSIDGSDLDAAIDQARGTASEDKS
jgi:hypothetical protein